MKKMLALFLVLVMMFNVTISVAATGTDLSEPDGSGDTHEHVWSNGVCTVDGCGVECAHAKHDGRGDCAVCGKYVGHNDFTDNYCSCGDYVQVFFDNSVTNWPKVDMEYKDAAGVLEDFAGASSVEGDIWSFEIPANTTNLTFNFFTVVGEELVRYTVGPFDIEAGKTYTHETHDYVDGSCTCGASCTHSWTDATCTAPKTCSVCKETEGNAKGHSWVDATCTTPKTCSVCKVTEGNAKGHTFDREKVDPKYLVSEATTAEKAVYKKSCKCGEAGEETFTAGNLKPQEFMDVPQNAYFHDAAMWAVENGVTTGTGEGTFSPDAICNRAQIVTFLSRAKNGQPTKDDNPFVDVAENAYYYNAVLWAVENKITTGTGDGTTFAPNEDCTRGQVITFLWRAYTK